MQENGSEGMGLGTVNKRPAATVSQSVKRVSGLSILGSTGSSKGMPSPLKTTLSLEDLMSEES